MASTTRSLREERLGVPATTSAADLAAVVLAAGQGRRLRPLTHLLPKALCPVNNVPLVDHAITRARVLTEAVAVNVHHGRVQMVAHLRDRVHLAVEEPEALGTAGAVGAMRGWIDGRSTLVVNADTWTARALTTIADGWDGERVRLLVAYEPQGGDFGHWRYVGAALLPWPVARDLLPIPSGLYEVSWAGLAARGALDLAPAAGRYIDCGTPTGYLAANMAASGGRSVIGAGAIVEGEVVRSVVWPGGKVLAGERLVDAVRIGGSITVTPAQDQSGEA